ADGELLGTGATLDVTEAGTYTLTVTDSVTKCTAAKEVEITSGTGAPDSVEITSVDPTCSVPTGSVRVDGTPVEGLTYVLVDTLTNKETPRVAAAGDTEIVFSGLPAGIYAVKVRSGTDAACESGASEPVTIAEVPGAPLAVNLEGVDPATCGLFGTISVTDPNNFEAGTFEYVLVDASTGEELSIQQTAVFSGVGAGRYFVRVRLVGDTGCVSPEGAEVVIHSSTAPPFAATVRPVQASCAAPGMIIVTDQNPTEPGTFEYVLVDADSGEELYAQASPEFGNVGAGRYIVRVRSTTDGGCISEASAVVAINTGTGAPDSVEITSVDPTCSVPTGSVRVDGTPVEGLTYVLVDTLTNKETPRVAAAGDTEIVFSGLPAGIYAVKVRSGTDAACESGASEPVTIAEVPGAPLAVNLEGVDPATCGLFGTISVTDPNNFEAGTFEYVLVDASTGEELSIQQTAVFSGVGAGRYFVRVRLVGDTGCVSPEGAEVVIHSSTAPPFAATVRPVQASCAAPGMIIVTDQNPTEPGTFEYVLVDADSGEELYAQASPEFGNVGAGRYIVRVRSTTDGGCISEASATVMINAGEGTSDWTISCPISTTLECGESTDISNTGEPIIESDCDELSTTYTYSDSELFGGCNSATGTFIRTFVVEDSEGNVKTCSQTIEIVDTAPPVFSDTIPKDLYVSCENPPEPIEPMIVDECGGEINVEYKEYRKDIQQGCATNSLIERVWTATDECGNESSLTQFVHVNCPLKVYNGISANGDGLNDSFIIEGIECYPDNNVKIFNRWGVLVFETDNYNNGTNSFKGFSQGRATISKRDKLPVGSYFYLISYSFMGGDGMETRSNNGYLYLH
ncbi:gliding motility-associated C-terminal domain-containing protein, partial [Allomuricauda taeanensis]|uniref:gliding motility-associated C-terminal domain-containing protein n=1 Tax=Flagellimonas taeanensis TaxID=1005926 RepID=UPI002E7B367F